MSIILIKFVKKKFNNLIAEVQNFIDNNELYTARTKLDLARELFPNTFHVLHHNNEGFNVSSKPVIPYTTYFISSPKNDGNLQIYKEYLKYLCIHHYSEDHKHFDKTFEKLYALPYINPKIMGIVNRENEPIEVPQLLETQELHLDDKSVCLFIHIPFLKKYSKLLEVKTIGSNPIFNLEFKI